MPSDPVSAVPENPQATYEYRVVCSCGVEIASDRLDPVKLRVVLGGDHYVDHRFKLQRRAVPKWEDVPDE